MSEDTQDQAATQIAKRPAPDVEYVVQVREVAPIEDGQDQEFWRDVTTVTVPARTKRKTVIQRALARVQGLVPSGPSDAPLIARVLSPEDAKQFRVSSVVRDPELRIEAL